MKKRNTIILVVLILFINCCIQYNTNKRKIDIINSSFRVEDCSFPVKSGKNTVIENHNAAEQYRSHYGLGTCHSFKGNQTVVLFFIDDEESSWSSRDIINFTNQRILPALDFLEEQAKAWDIDLSFTVKRFSTPLSEELDMVYDGTVIKDLSISGSTKDLPKQVADILGFNSELELLRALIEEYECDSIIPLMIINKDGTAYARNQLIEGFSGRIEHAVIFAEPLGAPSGSWRYTQRRSATTAHEILHLFGAEDYYIPDERLKLAEKYYIKDIMLLDSFRLSNLKIDKATAYYIGWSDQIPEVCYEEDWDQ